MNKKLLSLVLTFIVLVLVACGNKQVQGTANSAEVKVITVAASPVPHAELLNQIKDDMKSLGYDLQVREFNDYVLPNLAVDQGEVLANFFQHQPYLDDFNAERGTKVVSVGKVHYEPFGVYAGTKNSLELESGDKIAVPNDVTNEARSLNLLEAAGIIKLKSGVGLTATKLDIVENPYDVEIVELESAQIPRSLDSVAIACMNGNYAMEAGFKVSDALFVEPQNSEAAQTYANILCVKQGNENENWARDLVNCLRSKKVKDYIAKTYNQSVIAID